MKMVNIKVERITKQGIIVLSDCMVKENEIKSSVEFHQNQCKELRNMLGYSFFIKVNNHIEVRI